MMFVNSIPFAYGYRLAYCSHIRMDESLFVCPYEIIRPPQRTIVHHVHRVAQGGDVLGVVAGQQDGLSIVPEMAEQRADALNALVGVHRPDRVHLWASSIAAFIRNSFNACLAFATPLSPAHTG